MIRQFGYYALALAALTLLLKWMQYKFIIVNHAMELYVGLIAAFFVVIGGWVGWKLTGRKTVKEIVIVEKEVLVPAGPSIAPDQNKIKELGISEREMDVLKLVAAGCSNQEIADKLFLSLNTVKTHTSNLFVKLDVNRRTQAVQKAKSLGIIG
jgi:DNA-binding CsgD family transcriptional regulator